MDAHIEKINESDFKVIDYTPSETLYNVEILKNEIASLQNNIVEYNKLIDLQNEQIAKKQALIDSAEQLPTPVIETPVFEEPVTDTPME